MMANGFGRQWCGKAAGLVFISELRSLEGLLKSSVEMGDILVFSLILS